MERRDISTNCAFDLRVTKEKLDSPEIARAPVDKSGLGASQRMCSEKPWIQRDAADQFGNEARVLVRYHAVLETLTTGEQERAMLCVGDFQIVIDYLARLIAHFKSNWPSGLLLPHSCTIRRVSTRRDMRPVRL